MVTDSKYSTKTAWISCLIASVAFFDAFFQLNVLNGISRDIISNLHLTKTSFGLLSSMYLWGIVFFFIPAGILYDHYSEKILICTGVFLSAVITLSFAFSNNLAFAIVIRFLLGMTHALAFIGVIRFPTLLLKKHIELATSICLTLGLLGGLLSQAPFTELSQFIGWRNSFMLDGILGFILTAIMLVFIKRPPDKITLPRLNGKQLILNVLFILKNRSNWLLACYAGFLNLPAIVLGSAWGSLVLMALFHTTSMQASNIIGMIFLGLLIGTIITGCIANRLNNNRLIMLFGSILTTIFLITLTSLPLNMISLLLLFLVLGMSMSTQMLVYPAVISNNHDTLNSTAIGFISIIIMGSGACFQIMFAYVVSSLNYQASLIMLIITAVISGIFIVCLKK